MRVVMNFAMFYLGWFACVGGATQGYLWLGPLVTVPLLLLHLRFAEHRAAEARLMVAAGLFGFIADTVQATAGLYSFAGTSVAPWLCPPWMVALWMLFATTLNGSMAWLADRTRLAALLGALFGPLSYWGGARLGAIQLHADPVIAFSGIAVAWAVAMPSLLWLQRALGAAARTRVPGDVAGGHEMSSPR